MSVEGAIVAVLGADPGVVAQVGDRITPLPLPQGPAVWPRLSYTKTGGVPLRAMGLGKSLTNPLVEISGWSDHKAQAIAAAAAALAALRQYSGTADGTQIQAVLIENDGTGTIEPDTQLYRQMIEFTVWAVE